MRTLPAVSLALATLACAGERDDRWTTLSSGLHVRPVEDRPGLVVLDVRKGELQGTLVFEKRLDSEIFLRRAAIVGEQRLEVGLGMVNGEGGAWLQAGDERLVLRSLPDGRDEVVAVGASLVFPDDDAQEQFVQDWLRRHDVSDAYRLFVETGVDEALGTFVVQATSLATSPATATMWQAVEEPWEPRVTPRDEHHNGGPIDHILDHFACKLCAICPISCGTCDECFEHIEQCHEE